MELAATAFEPPAAARRRPASRRDLAGPEEVLDRHDNLTVARAIYRGRVEQHSQRVVLLCDRARVLARSDRPDTGDRRLLQSSAMPLGPRVVVKFDFRMLS